MMEEIKLRAGLVLLVVLMIPLVIVFACLSKKNQDAVLREW